MSTINSFSDYTSQYNGNVDFSDLFGGMDSTAAPGAFSLADYASIKNGSYGKLMKAYYAREKADKLSQTGDSAARLTMIKSGADSLKKSAEALSNASLWEKKKIKKKDEETGKEIEVEDYDWEAITKAVKSFVEDYNSLMEETGKSDTKNILQNAIWLTGMTEKAENLLSKAGISIGKGNKLELDEDTLKKADITTLKSLFTGYGSFVDKIAQRASRISLAAARTSSTYKRNGSYSDTLSKLLSGTVDEKV